MCSRNASVTWQVTDYKLPQDEICKSVIICELIVHLFVTEQTNTRSIVRVKIIETNQHV
jgi:hypothetical protein